MQFTCTACDRTYDISPRAFGPTHDTRTRCPNCKTWLIVTKSRGDTTTTVIDPEVAAAQALHAKSTSGQIPVSDARRPSSPAQPKAPEAKVSVLPAFGLHPQAPTDTARPAHRQQSSGFERLEKGLDLFSLPDPAVRVAAERTRRVQIGQVLQDFSMMVRLDTVKTDRKRQAIMALVLLAIGAGIYLAAKEKIAYDAGLDAAKEAKKLTVHFIVQSGEGEFVPVLDVLPLGATPTAAPAGRPKQVMLSGLGRQRYYKARTSARPVK
ncbi:MAG: hypothetical protein FJ100_09660 [Deltaproteobacteria bacterium]|nr:hypothetical protein [Deltaproteobacteria bacterium]